MNSKRKDVSLWAAVAAAETQNQAYFTDFWKHIAEACVDLKDGALWSACERLKGCNYLIYEQKYRLQMSIEDLLKQDPEALIANPQTAEGAETAPVEYWLKSEQSFLSSLEYMTEVVEDMRADVDARLDDFYEYRS